MGTHRIGFIFSIAVVAFSCVLAPGLTWTAEEKPANATPHLSYDVINTYPHDEQAFTQGLIYRDGLLYEGTGRYGKSELITRTLENINSIKKYKLPSSLFGEGITIFGDTLIQLTWRAQTGFVYDPENLRLIKSFSYATEGWGITHDGTHLIMSDGTNTIYFLDPENFKPVKQINVKDKRVSIRRINELEYISDKIYANIWRTDLIAIINPQSGSVEAWIDLKKLSDLAGGDNLYKTLNGIAYDKQEDRLFVTGKLWPYIFEIKITAPQKSDD